MKKTIRSIVPIVFGLLMFCLYIILYPSPAGSANFSVAVMLFLVALGSSSVVILPRKEDKLFLNLYFWMSIVIPAALVLFVDPYRTVQHRVICGLAITGIVFGRFFVAAHFKRATKPTSV